MAVMPLRKPEPRRREKARNDRAEKRIKDVVRAQVVERDGYCRLQGVAIFGPCKGASTWNHLTRRSKTMGQAPERRHNTETGMMVCRHHHRMLDEYEIGFEYRTAVGADGRMAFTLKKTGERYEERD